jgi:hypothetical protein
MHAQGREQPGQIAAGFGQHVTHIKAEIPRPADDYGRSARQTSELREKVLFKGRV